MKKTVYYFNAIILVLFFSGLTAVVLGQNDPFVSVWQTDNNGTSNNDEITIPGTGDFNYSWAQINSTGDTLATGTGSGSDVQTINFGGNGIGTYRISITPDNSNATPFNRIEFNNAGDKDKIINIEQWGDIVWASLENAYYGADSLMISATDTINLSNVTNMNYAFARTNIDVVANIDDWDVSTVTSMEGLFYKAVAFNDTLTNWDVSGVTTMDSMFIDAGEFNNDIGNWNVSNVTSMVEIFRNASKFNQNIGDWDIQNISDSLSFANSGMDCTNYSKTLHGWLFNPNLPSGIVLNAEGCTHSTDFFKDKVIFDSLYNWDITDNGKGTCLNILDDSYITVWKTDNPGTSQNDEVMIPATGDYDLYWAELDVNGDSTGVYGVLRANGNVTLNFNGNGAGTYRIRMAPNGTTPFDRIEFANADDKEKILDIEQWGKIAWSSMQEAYFGASNLTISATDAPNLTNVASMQSAFAGSGITSVPNFSSWNVSNVTDMSNMFKDAVNFNEDISGWNVNSVTDMSSMFENASSFNDTISNWMVNNVTNMQNMFMDATSYNAPLNSWNVSNVTNMNGMFSGASAFNQTLIDWDVSSVTDMQNIFSNASSFNESLATWEMIGLTGTLSLDNSGLSCENYSQTLFGWASNTNTPASITLDADGLSYSPDIVADRNNLINTFSWTINNDTQGSCTGIVLGEFITLWKTNNPGASNNNQITIPARGQFIYKWEEDGNPSNSGGGNGNNTTTITFPSSGTYQVSIFPTVNNPIDYIKFNNGGDKDKLLEIQQWGEIQWGTMKTAYLGASNLEITATDSPDLSNMTDMEYAFGFTNMTTIQNLENWDVSTITNMKFLFYNAPNFNQDISSWDISSLEDMSYMFAYATSFNQPIGGWDVSNVKDMSMIFNHTSSFNQSLENWELRNLSGDLTVSYSGINCHNYSRSLRAWAQDTNTVNNFTLIAEGIEYTAAAKSYRKHLIDSMHWMIYGDELGWCLLDVDEYNNLDQTLSVYPNPTDYEINIDGLQGNETVQLMDMTGRVIQTRKVNGYSLKLDMGQLAEGVYNLIITSETGQIINRKIIKQ